MRSTMRHSYLSAFVLLVAGAFTAGAYPYAPAAVGPVTPGQAFNLCSYTYVPINSAPASRSTRSAYVTPGQAFNLAGYTYAPIQQGTLGMARPVAASQPIPDSARLYLQNDTSELSPWSVEIAASANFATRPIMRKDWDELSPQVHTYGADITVARTITSGLSANIRFGFAYGKDSVSGWDEVGEPESMRFRVTNFILMPGLRYTFSLSESTYLFLGANIGILSRNLRYRENYGDGEYNETYKWHKSDYGFAYSAEIGLRYNVTPHIGIFAAYQISGSSARPKYSVTDEYGEYSCTSPHQYYNSVRCGLSYTF